MSDLRPIGSEKLQVEDKIKRIMEIARYGETTKNTDYHTATTSFKKKAVNGTTYAIVKEKDGYYVKSGLNESELDYIDGLSNKKKNRFRSYSGALKRVNLILKPINEEYNGGHGDPIFEQEEGDEERFVLKVDTPDAEMDMEDDMDMGDEDMDMGDEDMDMEDDEMDMEDDMGDEEVETEVEIETDIPSMKSIQKLTGKLGQKLRDAEEELDSESIKYVLNSVISAVNLENLDDEDMEDVMDRFEDEEEEYGMDDEVEVTDDEFGADDMDMEDEDMEMEMGDEEMEMDMEDEEEPMMESINKKVSKTLKKYFKQSKNEKVLKENRAKQFIKRKIQESKTVKQIEKASKSVEQELKAKRVIKENKNVTFLGTTKKGTLVFEHNNKRVGITPRGKVIK
jgi:hypothetical protein